MYKIKLKSKPQIIENYFVVLFNKTLICYKVIIEQIFQKFLFKFFYDPECVPLKLKAVFNEFIYTKNEKKPI